jgi:hypothetical protein
MIESKRIWSVVGVAAASSPPVVGLETAVAEDGDAT